MVEIMLSLYSFILNLLTWSLDYDETEKTRLPRQALFYGKEDETNTRPQNIECKSEISSWFVSINLMYNLETTVYHTVAVNIRKNNWACVILWKEKVYNFSVSCGRMWRRWSNNLIARYGVLSFVIQRLVLSLQLYASFWRRNLNW